MQQDKPNIFPATCTVHWASGPVNTCEKHALALIGLGKMLGSHIVATVLKSPAECSNCKAEASLYDSP